MKTASVILVTSMCLFLTNAAGAEPTRTPPVGTLRLASTWIRCGGPLGGLGYDVRMNPASQDTMFVTDAFAGVFRSLDAGATWQPANQGLSTFGGPSGDAIPAFCLTIDPSQPGVVWAGFQGVRGIYKSTNWGESWIEKTNGIVEPNGISVRGITVDPFEPDFIYAAAEISSWIWNGQPMTGREFDMTQGVIYRSDDGGESWSESWRGDNLARYIWIDPRDTNTLYASTGIFDREAANSDTLTSDAGGVGIIKSVDRGVFWEERNDGLTNLYVGSLFVHPLNPDILLAGCSNNAYPDGAGVFLSTDGAETWTRVLADGVQSVEFSLSNPQIAYAGNPGSVYRSTDGGLTWPEATPVGNSWGPPGVEAGFPIDFQVDPFLPNRLFANNYGGGNFLSDDGGQTWSAASTGYTGAQVRDIAVAPEDAGRVYAAARSGLFVSFNAGQEWEGRSRAPATGLEWNAVSIDPGNSFHLLAANNYTARILESHDGGETWRDAGATLPGGNAWRCFTFAPSANQTVYAGSGAFLSAGGFDGSRPAMGIYKSTNGGQSWNAANDSTSQFSQVATLAVAPQDPLLVYAASTNQGILKTTNGGGDWIVSNAGLPPSPRALSVAIHPTDANHVFAGLEIAGLNESTNGGLTWTPVAPGLPPAANVTSIVFHPADHDLIYLSDQLSGVYRSSNGGVSWTAVNDSLRTRAVNALVLSGDGLTLYAATEGEGVFRLDGAGPAVSVPELPRSVAAFGLEPSYPNPFSPSVTIGFSLREATRASLRIFDARGRLVRVLLDERRGAGRHGVVWDGRDDEGRIVVSGIYFARLTAAGEVRSAKVVRLR